MLKRLARQFSYLTGAVALFAFVMLLAEHAAWLRPHAVWIRRINLTVLCLFATDVLLNFYSGKRDLAWLRQHGFDLIVFVPLVQFFYAQPGSALALILRQAAIIAMLLSRTRRARNFITLFSLKPAQLMILGFAGTILCGTVLLMLPAATADGETTTLLNALFTATSAVCVTGLIVYDTAAHFTPFGQAVILALIQVGGLGIMTFSVSLALLMRRGMSIKDQSVMQDVLDQETLLSVRRLVGFIVTMTVVFELAGAAVLFPAMRPACGGPGEAAWHALFHSVSAFCNAGFSTFSDNLAGFAYSLPVNFTVGMLIVLGGIGFIVIGDFHAALRNRLKRGRGPKHKFRIQSRLALGWTGGLILLGAALFYAIERERILAGLPYDRALLVALFQSVTTRTAGFNTCDFGALQPATLFFCIVLMFIGACPGGTGGGVKVTTPAVLWAVLRAGFRRSEDAELYRRTVPVEIVQKAVAVLCISLLLLGAATGLMAWFEADKEFLDVFFETVSAFGTVGLSTGITGSLSRAGRLLIIALMFIGRLGPLTIGFAFLLKARPAKYRYAEERIMIG